MNITGIPTTFQDVEQFFHRYERENIVYSPAGFWHLVTGTVQVLKSRLPAPARPVAQDILSAMFDDVRLTDALSLPRTTRLTETSPHTVMESRNAIHRRRPLSTKPHSIPGEAGSSRYSNGSRLDDIGPENIVTT